ncbi:MAG: glycosyltransferase family 4 protein [Phaeodactylibacter sp.]|uniref:glycosyltransferase family 4 protein n=1 Tax=Phaeodactylibacter sp. TaxID=1940289 RepID=UPI0032ED7C3E
MRILQLCKKFPFPLKDGESIAVTALSRAMKALGHEVHLLAMNTSKHFFPVEELPRSFDHYASLHTVEVDNRVKPLQALWHLKGEASYHIARFCSKAFEDKLAGLLKNTTFDVIQLETPYLAPYIPVIRKYSNAVVSMRAHNVEFEIWERISQNTAFWPKRWYLQHLTERLRQYEISQLAAYDHLAAITRRDLERFQQLGYEGSATVTPIGVDSGAYPPDFSSFQKPLSLSFIGSLDWMPNLEGLQWFLDEVWPEVRREHPDLTLHIAGRNTPKWLLRMDRPGIVVEGEVPSATTFINQHSLMVVPLLSGSGMRAKILEGMALGKAVISTQMGMEGIGVQQGVHALIANTPADFARQVAYARALQKKGQLEQLGREARRFVLDQYDSLEVARRLVKAYAELSVEAL